MTALRGDAASGVLAELCANVDVDLLLLFGSSVDDPQTASDVDLAFSVVGCKPGDELAVVVAVSEAYGYDHLDCMALNRADPVALMSAFWHGEVLVEGTPDKFAEGQLRAFGLYRDTQHLCDLTVEVFAR